MKQRSEDATYFCTRLGDSSEVVHKVSLGHADSCIPQTQHLVLFVGNNKDMQVLFRLEDRGISERGISDFIEGIGAVGDQLSKEDLLVGVESVWKRSMSDVRDVGQRKVSTH